MQFIYKHLNGILFTITIFVSLNTCLDLLNIVFFTIPEELYQISQNISLAWISSYIFYFVIVFIPERRNRYYNIKFMYKYIMHFIHTWTKFKESIYAKQEITMEDYHKYDLYIQNNKLAKSLAFIVNHMKKLIDKSLTYANEIDQETALLLSDIDTLLLSLSVNNEIIIIGFTNGQYSTDTVIKINSIVNKIKIIEKKNIEIAQKHFSKIIQDNLSNL